MKRTKILSTILVILLFAIVTYYIVVNYEEISTDIATIVKKFKTKTVVIPNYTKNHRYYVFKAVNETNNFKPQNKDDIKDIYYTVLNNGWDSFTFYCPPSYEKCIDDVKEIAQSDENSYITLINNYVSPFNIYKKYNTLIIDENEINLTVEKLYTDDEIKEINKIVDDYLEKNKISSKNVTVNTIKKIHDYLIKNITYDVNYKKDNKVTDSNKATGALFKGVALCSGYSDSFAIFLDKLNVPNFRVTTEEHEWNAIYFDNKWSHIDITWDDDEINKNNNRNFFMITTKDLLKKDKKEHNFNSDLFVELR